MKKLNKKITKQISDKFGWKLQTTEKAIDQYSKYSYILNSIRVLEICVKSKNPHERIKNFSELPLNNSDFNTRQIVTELIQHGFLNFNVISSFNILDALKTTNGDKRNIDLLNKISQLDTFLLPGNITNELIETYAEQNFAILNPSEIQYRILESFIISRLADHMIDLDKIDSITQFNSTMTKMINEQYFDFICSLIPDIGFRVFNFQTFLELVDHCYVYDNKPSNWDKLEHLISSFNKTTEKKQVTNQHYWYIYCLVSEITNGLKIDVKPACRIASELLNDLYNTIHRRYYEKNRVIEKSSLTLEKIVYQYSFRNQLDQHLMEINETKEFKKIINQD